MVKNSNSTGYDGLSTEIFKKCIDPLSNILAYYINDIIESNKFPDRLKIAKIIPIYKKAGSKYDSKNYRPISLLDIASKIVEAAIYNRLYGFLELQIFFDSNQFGFIKKSNKTSACLSFIDKIQRSLNEKKIVSTIFLDVAKAFDCVDRNILLKKLEQFGIRGKSLDIFDSYINNRKQFVQINNSKSVNKLTKFGIAQGSKLGPLLFIIFMSDLLRVKLNGHLQLHADYSSITYIADTYESLYKMINADLCKISDWFKNNLLVLHGDKLGGRHKFALNITRTYSVRLGAKWAYLNQN